MTSPRFSIIVPSFNSQSTLVACLNAAQSAAEAYGDAEVIVVDHCSTDGSRELLEARFGTSVRVCSVSGGSIARVRNAGASVATGHYFAFIDSDCVVVEDYLFVAREVFLRTQAVAAGAPVDIPDQPHWIEETWKDLHQQREDGWIKHINSGNFIVLADAFERAGGFGEKFVVGEDAEFCQRLRRLGGRLYSAKRLRAIHLRNPKSVAEFIRKEYWHGLGFSTVSFFEVDLPVLATLAHVTSLFSVVLLVTTGVLHKSLMLLVVVLIPWLVPLLAVSYRSRRSGRPKWLVRSLALYQLYFCARAAAFTASLLGFARVKNRTA